MGFLCLVQPKSISFGNDAHFHREQKAKELGEDLSALTSGRTVTTMLDLEGGAMAVLGGSSSGDGKDEQPVYTARIGDTVAVFQGKLKNLSQLAAAYDPELAHHSKVTITDDRISQEQPAESGSSSTADSGADGQKKAEQKGPNAAEMVIHCYQSLGLPMLAHLQGQFSFCMYDAKQMRVLAARDGSGSVDLYQARSPKDSLVISSEKQLLEGCHDTVQFQPGFFKYGWHSDPRLFTPDALVVPRRSSIDQHADNHHHAHHHHHTHHHGHRGGQGSRTGSRRQSMDTGATGAPGHTVYGTPPGSKGSSSGGGAHHSSHGRPRSGRGGGHAAGGSASAAGSWRSSHAAGGSDSGTAAGVGGVTSSLMNLNVNAKEFVPSSAAAH